MRLKTNTPITENKKILFGVVNSLGLKQNLVKDFSDLAYPLTLAASNICRCTVIGQESTKCATFSIAKVCIRKGYVVGAIGILGSGN